MPSSPTITIDVTKDLENLSDLKTFFDGQSAALFHIGSEIAQFSGQPIQAAVGKSSGKLALAGDHSWKLPSGISFSLKADANCTVTISDTSSKFSIRKSIDSADKTDISDGPNAGHVYINVEADFDISGNLGGSGTVSGVGIAGKAAGAENATLSYCHPVSGGIETILALKGAFSALFFPFRPDCALRMPVESIGRISFAGSFSTEFDLSYGFGSYKFSAQSLGAASDSISIASGADKLKPPDITLDAGAKASISYKHTDNFTVIVTKPDVNAATVHLLRSEDNEIGQSLGLTVGISASKAKATLNTDALAHAISSQVKAIPPGIAETLANSASSLQNSLVSKANSFLSSHKDDTGLMFSLSQQHDRTVLFSFNVNLTAAGGSVAQQSWTAMIKGDLGNALNIGGFTLLEDSGVAEALKHTSAIQLHFFNFQLAAEHDFFTNSVVKLGPDGSIRFFFDVGEVSKFTVDHNSTTETIHFVATATADNWAGAKKALEVDLYIELSEKGNFNEANRIAGTIGSIPGSAVAQDAQKKILDYFADNKDKTLTLINIFKASAYGQLSCSFYTTDANGTSHPPAPPQKQDQFNWSAFQNEAEVLMGHDLAMAVSEMSYAQWARWNVYYAYQVETPDPAHVPDRRASGALVAAAQHVFHDNWQRYYSFLTASTGFMNFCDDLHSLTTNANANWDDLRQTLESLIKADTDSDWSKAAAGAILNLCSPLDVQADFQQAKDNSTLTCTLTLSRTEH
jgi:hypothetical protein